MNMEPLFLKGQRIELISMGKDPCPIPAGTRGTVLSDSTFFQASWQTVVKWDIPRSLALVSPPDVARVIDGLEAKAAVDLGGRPGDVPRFVPNSEPFPADNPRDEYGRPHLKMEHKL